MDREEYFIGDEAVLTLSVTNPQPQTIEILAPFRGETGRVGLLKKTGRPGLEWEFETNDHVVGGPVLIPRWIGPGARLESRVRLNSFECPHHMLTCHFPDREGEYMFVFGYGKGASAKFRVVTPLVHSVVDVPISRKRMVGHNDARFPRAGVYTPVDQRARVAVLEHAGLYYVVVRRASDSRRLDEVEQKAEQMRADRRMISGEFCPCVRLATSSIPITSLRAQADAADNLAVAFIDAEGKRTAIRVDANGDPILE
jgi:hypothetical protein